MLQNTLLYSTMLKINAFSIAYRKINNVLSGVILLCFRYVHNIHINNHCMKFTESDILLFLIDTAERCRVQYLLTQQFNMCG